MLQARPSRSGHRRSLALLAAGVVVVHGLLLGGMGRVQTPPGLAGPIALRPVVQLIALQDSFRSPIEPGTVLPASLPPPMASVEAGTELPAQHPPSVVPKPRPKPAVPLESAGRGAGRLPPEQASSPPDAVPADSPAADPGAPAAAGPLTAPADPAAAEISPAVSGGEPPPLYAARPPAAASLRYALHYYGRSGEAVLSWRPAGTSYALQLQGLPAAQGDGQPAPQPPGRAGRQGAGRPLIEQASQGQLDPHGLVPERFTDRRHGRGQRAANFRRELGRIEFSGPATRLPAWPGAQDRLSWWVQMPAIVAAAATLPAEIRLFVVDAQGRGELWRFEHLGTEAGPGQSAVQHWQHEPTQAEGQRVELWLDPAQGHWPVRLRLSSLRSGERFELQLLAIDPWPP